MVKMILWNMLFAAFFIPAHASDSLSQSRDVDAALTAVVRCKVTVLPIGNAVGGNLGREIGIWWTKRSIYNEQITPFVNESVQLGAEDDGYSVDRSANYAEFLARLEAQPLFTKCPEKTEAFLEVLLDYVDILIEEKRR